MHDIVHARCLINTVNHRSHTMRFAPFILGLALVEDCAHDDARLHGTWHSNRDATVAAAFERDPRWTNATPAKVERFKEMFGHLTVTYSNGVATSDYRGKIGSFRYRVVKLGPDYNIIRYDAVVYKGRDIKIRFVDGDNGYWIDTLVFGEERFDKVTTIPNQSSEPTPIDHRRSAVAGSVTNTARLSFGR